MLNENHEKDSERVENLIAVRNLNKSFANGGVSIEILKGLNFDLPAGETVAIVGHTGAGKTTRASLLTRFYDVQRGRVIVSGTDVREWSLSALRQQFGIVLQDVHLFSGTLASNIRLGDTDITDEAVAAAAKAVHLDAWVKTLPSPGCVVPRSGPWENWPATSLAGLFLT